MELDLPENTNVPDFGRPGSIPASAPTDDAVARLEPASETGKGGTAGRQLSLHRQHALPSAASIALAA